MALEPAARWWALSGDEVLALLGSDHGGLGQDEVASRLREIGPNRIETADRLRAWRLLFHQFASPLVYVLLAALIVTLFIQHWADAIVISIVLLLNASVGFVQEYRAESAMQALMSLITPRATVRRRAERIEIASEMLVPGDIVLLESGVIVPADLRLLDVVNLQINEAVLTGESDAVTKRSDRLSVDGEVPLPEQRNMAFMGTAVSGGRAKAVVVATGARTRIGEIAEKIRDVRRAETPLQRRMRRFATRLALAVVCASLAAFVIGLWRGEPLSGMFLISVAIAVSAMPEGLPVVMTITLAISVRRMARRRAIVRRLPAVETLGSCSVIVTDKTGTLTENRMTARSVWSGARWYRLTGESLDEAGRLEEHGKAVTLVPQSPLALTLMTGLLNNDADLRRDPATGGLIAAGDPTEVALLMAARKAGVDREQLLAEYPILHEIPFSSERQFSATVHRHNATELVLVKGAPERIVEMCDRLEMPDGSVPIDPDTVLAAAQQIAVEGQRVLAMAQAVGPAAVEAVRGIPRNLTFVGFVGMLDPPRPAVPAALARCRDAGIRVIMVTGDHASTAAAIARQTGLVPTEPDPVTVHTGVEIGRLSDDELSGLLENDLVYARIAPDQKLRIVNLLREAGEVVAVTGDGVNDAPALKAAHIGAAMGKTGTDVAREASEMVLADDNIATVYAAVEEGRTAFANMRKASFFLISSGVAELLAILASLTLGMPLPFLPAQILWLNVVTNGIQNVGLAFEPGEPYLFRQPPRPLREGVLSKILVERTVLVGLLMAACTLAIFAWEISRGADLAYAQVAALTAMVVFQIIHVGNCRSETASAFRRSVFSNPLLLAGSAAALGVHVLAMITPWTQYLLRLEPLSARTWLTIGLAALSVVLVVELHKLMRRRVTG